jgi:hypothetical protein
MLEKIDPSQRLPIEEYKRMLPRLQRRLDDLEKSCWDANLDPRGFKLYPRQASRTSPGSGGFGSRFPAMGK